MATIQFVYFDLGNVLVHFDPAQACRNVAQWANVSLDAVQHAVWESGLQHRFEQGAINRTQFVRSVCQNLKIGDHKVDPSGQPLCDLLCDMFVPDAFLGPMIVQLQRLPLRIGILSNTCVIHWEWIQRKKWSIMQNWSDETLLSYELGCTKPDPRIYQRAAEQANVPPESIFFTDDRAENVAAAIQFGWQAVVYQGPEKLRDDLLACGVEIDLSQEVD